ncbi:MAG: hypothetical protein ACL7BU_05360 [Candidatus Phlomobacter fragariae]
MTMNQDVIIARIIAASKDIFTCEKAIVTLKNIYHSVIRQYLIKNDDPREYCGSLSPKNQNTKMSSSIRIPILWL